MESLKTLNVLDEAISCCLLLATLFLMIDVFNSSDSNPDID